MSRIGFLYPEPDPTAPRNWSGIPHGLAAAISALGVELVPIRYSLPPVIRHAVYALSHAGGRRRTVAHAAPVKAAARSRVLRGNLARAGRLDGLIAMGTDQYDLLKVVPPGLPVATFDDGTFALFMRHADSDLRRNDFPEAEVSTWCERQRAAARRADACCVSTSWAGNSMVADYGVPADRVHVVGMGHRSRPGGASRDWSRPRLLFVGVEWGRKNGDVVVRAFTRLRRELPDATLDLVGEHPPVEGPGITAHGFLALHDPAAQRRIDDLYVKSTCFVLPSRFDPSPIAYLEAASAGLPVIATTEGGAGELLGDAAISVHPDDEAGLLDAMRLLADPATARRAGDIATSRAGLMTWSGVAGRILGALGVDFDGTPVPLPAGETGELTAAA
jgi:glycosyltransferase involved in cell wall biosynthesis